MKKVIMIMFSALLLSGTAVLAQAPTTPAPNVLKWKSTNIDMGKVPQGTPATATFDFTNTGSAPVVLKTVQPGCGCTTSDYTKEPVSKNKSGFVKATYNAANAGQFSKSITVTTDASEQVVLIIHGEVVPKPTAPTGK
jgi:hypothetical protein